MNLHDSRASLSINVCYVTFPSSQYGKKVADTTKLRLRSSIIAPYHRSG